MSEAQEAECPQCQGSGMGDITPRCCHRSQWECGGRGCIGPEPEQQQCEWCGGSGRMPILHDELLKA